MARPAERLRLPGGAAVGAPRPGPGVLPEAPDAGWAAVVHDSIHDIPAAQWDALNGACAVERSHACLAAIEDAAIAGCRWFYPVVCDADGVPAAQACVGVVMTDLAQALPPLIRRIVACVRRVRPGFAHARIAECGAPMVAAHALTLAPGRPAGPLLAALEAAVRRLAAREDCGLVVFRDFTAAECAFADRLRAFGYRRVQSVPCARLALEWTHHGDYVAAMRSRYRKDLKRRLARARAAGQSVRVRLAFGDEADRWAAQARSVQASSRGFRREAPTPAYYRNLDRALGEKSVLLTVETDGEAVAHGMVLFDDAHAVATYFGRDPGPPRAEWFHLLDAAIRLAIERGCTSVHLGRGSYDAKSLAGAEVEPLYVYVRSRNRLLNRLLALLPEAVVSRPRLTHRRVFHDD